MNNKIGKNFTGFERGMEGYWHLLNETETYKEYEAKRPDGCSFAVRVNKQSNIVKNWRFTSLRNLCEKRVYVPGA